MEFDPNRDALITPTPPALTEPMPERVVMCFFPEAISDLPHTHGARQIGEFPHELGGHKIYRMMHGEIPVAVFHPGVGAPLAVQHFEKAIAADGRSFVPCGSAGAIRPGLPLGPRRPPSRLPLGHPLQHPTPAFTARPHLTDQLRENRR